jgi:very-short-patch-repair endonuclease
VTELAGDLHGRSVVHVDRLVAAVAGRQCEIVTSTQLRFLGLTARRIALRVERGVLYPLHRGVFVWGRPDPEPPGRAVAAVYACGEGAVLMGDGAAARWRMRPEPERPIDVTIVGDRRVRRRDITTHRTGSLDVRDIRTLHGIPLTSPARTLLDIAAELPAHDLAAALERAQIDRLVTKRDLQATLDRAPGRAGAPALRARLDEPAFTRSRAERLLVSLLQAAKLPRPAFNHKVEGFEADAVWLPERVILEFDSHAFHATRAAFQRDRRRDAAHARAGYLVLRTIWHELTRESHALIARIAETLARR